MASSKGAARPSRPGGQPDPSLLCDQLGVELDPELVVLALTHRSYAYENGNLPTNERLEFLGDSVLGIAITERLYRDHPDLPEGRLAKLRASIVNMNALAGVGRGIGLGEMLSLGKGEEMTGGRDKASIVSDAVEAVLGAVYLQHGLETARALIHRLFAELLREAPLMGAGLDWKTSLQEFAAGAGLGVPEYRITEAGPDHAKTFQATVIFNARPYGNGAGRTKKEAEQQAASAAYAELTAPAEPAPAEPTSVEPTGSVTDRAAGGAVGGPPVASGVAALD